MPRQCRPHLSFLMCWARRNSPSHQTPRFIPELVCNAYHHAQRFLILAWRAGAAPHLPWVCVLGAKWVEVTGSSLLCASF